MQWDNFWRKLILFSLLIVMLIVGYKVRNVLVVGLMALALSYLLEPLVAFLERHRFSRTMSILVIYGGIVCAASLIFWGAMPQLAEQVRHLQTMVLNGQSTTGKYIYDFIEQLGRLPYFAQMGDVFREIIDNVQQIFLRNLLNGLQSLWSVLTYLPNLFLVPVLSFYLLKDKVLLLEKFWLLLPMSWHDDIEMLGREIHQLLRNFLLGSVIVSTIVAMIVTAGLMLVKMDFALICGLIVGAFNIIPYFGAIIGAIPAVVIALLTSIKQTIAVIVIMLIAQQLESNIITPKIIGERIGVHPIAVVLGIMVWGKIFGLWGVLLAVPITGSVKLILAFLLRRLIPAQSRQLK